MRKSDPAHGAEEGFSDAEWSVIRDLELVQKYMSRLCVGLAREDLLSEVFHVRVQLLAEGLLDRIIIFKTRLQEFL